MCDTLCLSLVAFYSPTTKEIKQATSQERKKELQVLLLLLLILLHLRF